MKIFVPLFCMLIAAVPAAAQGTAEAQAPSIEIVKFSWSKERIGWQNDPFNASGESYYARRDRVSTERRVRSALEERSMRAGQEEQKKPTVPPRYVFNYKLSVNNSGTKAIKEIDWDYIFTDAATGAELERRQFTSVETIGAGKQKGISIFAASPPTHKIRVYTLGKNEHDGLVEKILIVRVQYADDTVWEARP